MCIDSLLHEPEFYGQSFNAEIQLFEEMLESCTSLNIARHKGSTIQCISKRRRRDENFLEDMYIVPLPWGLHNYKIRELHHYNIQLNTMNLQP